MVCGKSNAVIRVEVPKPPEEIVVNDGSVPESDTTNNVFKIEWRHREVIVFWRSQGVVSLREVEGPVPSNATRAIVDRSHSCRLVKLASASNFAAAAAESID